MAGLNGFMVGLMALRLNFLLPGPFAHLTHFTEPHHRIHDLAFGFLFLPVVAGMLARRRRSSQNVAGQLMAVIPLAGLVLTLFTVIGVGLLASLRPDGWRLAAWVAGLLPALLGLASLAFPYATSSLGPVWALTAVAWGGGLVAAAELTRIASPAPDSDRVDPDRGSPAGRPRWLQVCGAIGLALILLFVSRMFIGGGGHRPDRHVHQRK